MVRYIIYDKEDNYVYGGTIRQLAKYFKTNENSIRSSISRINCGKRKLLRRKYKVYKEN